MEMKSIIARCQRRKYVIKAWSSVALRRLKDPVCCISGNSEEFKDGFFLSLADLCVPSMVQVNNMKQTNRANKIGNDKMRCLL